MFFYTDIQAVNGGIINRTITFPSSGSVTGGTIPITGGTALTGSSVVRAGGPTPLLYLGDGVKVTLCSLGVTPAAPSPAYSWAMSLGITSFDVPSSGLYSAIVKITAGPAWLLYETKRTDVTAPNQWRAQASLGGATWDSGWFSQSRSNSVAIDAAHSAIWVGTDGARAYAGFDHGTNDNSQVDFDSAPADLRRWEPTSFGFTASPACAFVGSARTFRTYWAEAPEPGGPAPLLINRIGRTNAMPVLFRSGSSLNGGPPLVNRGYVP